MNKRHYEHTLPNIRGSLSNTYEIRTETKNKNTGKKGKRKRRHLIRKALAESGKKPYLY